MRTFLPQSQVDPGGTFCGKWWKSSRHFECTGIGSGVKDFSATAMARILLLFCGKVNGFANDPGRRLRLGVFGRGDLLRHPARYPGVIDRREDFKQQKADGRNDAEDFSHVFDEIAVL